MEFFSRKAVILGAGLLGGSLGMVMRRRNLAGKIHVWSPSERTRAACGQADWCDAVHSSPEEACEGADLIFLCGPVDTIGPLMESIAPHCGHNSIISDVGSTKEKICEAGKRVFPEEHPSTFIGSHPMAGSEKSGLAHASDRLFDGKTCILTPDSPRSESLQRLKKFWEATGMILVECSPEEHDRIVANVSHLPHAVAAILCTALADRPEEWMRCAGSGLRDTTRIAAGDPKLWAAIFRENEEAFRESLDHFSSALNRLQDALKSPDDASLLRLLETGRDFRTMLDRKNLSDDTSSQGS